MIVDKYANTLKKHMKNLKIRIQDKIVIIRYSKARTPTATSI